MISNHTTLLAELYTVKVFKLEKNTNTNGFVVFNHSPEDEVVAKYRGYCIRCFHSFWMNEIVVKGPEGKRGFVHRNCLIALADKTPRKMSPEKARIFGEVDKGKMKKKVKKKIASSPQG